MDSLGQVVVGRKAIKLTTALGMAVLLVLAASVASASAARLVPVGTFVQPTFVTSDPADPDRLLVAERRGRVYLAEGAGRQLLANLEDLVQCCEGERGLLSIAPAPDFASSGRFYAAYTGEASAGGLVGDIHVDSFLAAPGGGTPAQQRILTIPHSTHANHNGGQLQIGRDGYLYVSTGDGGGAGDPDGNAQDLDSLLGKILRIDPQPGETPPYAIPPGNPFVAGPGADEIWASGLRNPWRFSFDRLTGTMAIADVGQDLREEVDIGIAGANYGWNCREGSVVYPGAPSSCATATGFTAPVFDYPHTAAGCGGSITGGYVVRDFGLGDLYGRYLYSDYCVGQLRSLVLPSSPGGLVGGDRSEGLTVFNPVSFGEDSCGRIYVVAQAVAVLRLEGDFGPGCHTTPPAAPAAPAAVAAERGIRPLVLLIARGGRRHVVRLIVRLLPCGKNGGKVVWLNRNGRTFRHKRLSRSCVARFRVRIGRRARFRAFFEDQRSQVRKIAFAKPRP